MVGYMIYLAGCFACGWFGGRSKMGIWGSIMVLVPWWLFCNLLGII
jgi:hypothetical protein